MRRYIVIFLFLVQLEAATDVKISEKLIVSSSQSEKMASENLLKLKVYFMENPITRVLNAQDSLMIDIEKLDTYYTVVIKPIHSLEVRNKLLVILSPLFPDIFYIDYVDQPVKVKTSKLEPNLRKKKVETFSNSNEKISFIDEVGLQWLALWCLSLVGLILSVRNRRKMMKIAEKQNILEQEQSKIESEIKTLGGIND